MSQNNSILSYNELGSINDYNPPSKKSLQIKSHSKNSKPSSNDSKNLSIKSSSIKNQKIDNNSKIHVVPPMNIENNSKIHEVPPMKIEKKTESPIKNEIARKILEEMLYNNPEKMNSHILEFRRKKVIKSRVSKFYELFKSQDYNQSLENINNVEKDFIQKPKILASKFIKKIRKSPILRRLYNFWKKKSNHYQTCYKILEVVNEPGFEKYVEETSDLTKQQFPELNKK